jgi:rhamnosyltransferase
VPYAEDQLLATEMLAAGLAKAYVPDAGVIHSHDYPPVTRFRRFFDEFRGLREVYGHVEKVAPRHTLGTIRRQVIADRAFAARRGMRGEELRRATLESLGFHAIRAAGAAIGSRADLLPGPVRRWCSLERRESFEPVEPRVPALD